MRDTVLVSDHARRHTIVSVIAEVDAVIDKSRVPFEELALNAEEVGLLLGCSDRQVLERIACKRDFPKRLSIRPATWIAREVLEWREKNRGATTTLGGRPKR